MNAPVLSQQAQQHRIRSERYIVGMLCTVYTLSCIDRNIVNILLESIKDDLHLADWQLGIITGIAFALFYTLLGIPLATFADRPRTHRPRLIAVCIGFWSLMTAVCGMAANFPQLLLARMGVGIGEAGGGPAAHALIGDLIPAKRRATAMGIYALGIPLGSLFGLSVGGALALHFGWRAAFMIVGLPGLLLAALVWLTIPEPRTSTQRSEEPPKEPFWRTVALIAHSRVFVGITAGATLITVLLAGQGAFLGSFMMRLHHLNIGEAGLILGLTIGGGGAIGSLFGGRIVDRFAAHDPRLTLILPIASILLGALFFCAALWSNHLSLTIGLLALSAILVQSWFGPAFSAILRVTPSRRRATAAALHAFTVNLIGVGLGPLLVGALSDMLNHGVTFGDLELAGIGSAEGLRYALLTLGLMPPLAALAFFSAANALKAEIQPDDV